MCGISGFINLTGNGSSPPAERAFKELLIVGQIRGSDATGMVRMDRGGKTDWVKINSIPNDLLDGSRGREFTNGPSTFVWLGHNRAGTMGGNTKNNAHPFETTSFIGVHNGTLKNKYNVVTNGHRFDVDSEALFHAIEEKGVKDALKGADGAYSIVYLDKKNHTVNFCRNEERPMWFLEAEEIEFKAGVQVTKNKFIFFGSEIQMLQWICGRNGFKLGTAIQAKPLTHYSFGVGDQKPHLFEVEKYSSPITMGSFRGGAESYRDWEEYDYRGSKRSRRYGPPTSQKEIPKPVSVIATVSDLPRLTGPLATSDDDDSFPYQIGSMPYLKDVGVTLQKKKTLCRVFREALPGSDINFVISDFSQLAKGYQLNGKLTGSKKEGLPVIIVSLVDKWFFDEEIVGKDTIDGIWGGKVASRGLSQDGKLLVLYVRDLEVRFTDVSTKEAGLNVAC